MSAKGVRLYFIQTKSLHKSLAGAVYSRLQHLFAHGWREKPPTRCRNQKLLAGSGNLVFKIKKRRDQTQLISSLNLFYGY
ncbi:MAG TPA: hypothetical protein PKW50_07915, partial [Syntrophomonas sp.]|nr:hypothetical protein [Syntrophomonas sp.]